MTHFSYYWMKLAKNHCVGGSASYQSHKSLSGMQDAFFMVHKYYIQANPFFRKQTGHKSEED